MNWKTLTTDLSDDTGLPKRTVRDVLDAFRRWVTETLERGEPVRLRGLGRLEVRERAPRVIRAIHDQRKYYVGKRYTVRFRPAESLRSRVEAGLSDDWREPAHQAAWRLAETLISDLALYHGDRAPVLDASRTPDELDSDLESAFGPPWRRIRKTYDSDVPVEVRDRSHFLVEGALRRWSS